MPILVALSSAVDAPPILHDINGAIKYIISFGPWGDFDFTYCIGAIPEGAQVFKTGSKKDFGDSGEMVSAISGSYRLPNT